MPDRPATIVVDADTVKALLAVKHSKDVFVAECKNGPTWFAGGGLGILDAWAMKRSWANPCTWGYEVKITRADFLQDNKWQTYLSECNQFYFVCPSGVIRLDECPDEAGLMYVSKTGTRLYTKKKAPHRAGGPSVEILQYILFSRAIIEDRYHHRDHEDKRQFWTRWLKEKKIDQELGWRVGKALGETIRTKIVRAEQKLADQAKDIARLEPIRVVLRDMGLSADYAHAAEVRAQAEMLAEMVPPDLVRKLGAAEQAIANCRDSLKKHVAERSKGGPG